MQAKNLLVRKALYGLMMLTLILSAFGVWNVSPARAQETATETLAGATVSLSAHQMSFSAAEGVILRVTITNPNSYPIRILRWLTPINGVEGNLFAVTRDGSPVGYIGKLVKRVASTEADYITLAAGESLSRAVDLSTYYDLSVSGKYVVKYNVTSAGLYAMENGRQFNADGLSSNEMGLTIEGRAKRVLQSVLPAVVTGTNTFVGCSDSQQTDTINARIAASVLDADAVAYFAANKQGERYTTWFGAYDVTRYNKVASIFTAEQTAMDTANPMKFDCTCADAGVYAYVYPDQPYDVYLCPVFWTSPATGTDSKAGTLVHELTHFTVIGATGDYGYGQDAVKALAISDPAKAITNAEGYTYFAENNPLLEAGPTTTFADVPTTHPQYKYIQALWDAGLTGGCSTSPLKFCPDTVLDRAQSAVFMVRGSLGSTYTPPLAPWPTFLADNWTGFEWAQSWAEGMFVAGLTQGCQQNPYKFCPGNQLPRVEASIFGLKIKNGNSYLPPAATGTVFADFPATDPSYWGIAWAEQAYADGLLPACGTDAGTGKPMFCPGELVNRGWGAYLIVKAKGLPTP